MRRRGHLNSAIDCLTRFEVEATSAPFGHCD